MGPGTRYYVPPHQVESALCNRQCPQPADKLTPYGVVQEDAQADGDPGQGKASRVPEGLWVKCPGCSQVIYNKDLATNLNVCPKCAHHFRLNATERLRMLFDGETWEEFDPGLSSTDPLNFTDTKPYKTRLAASIEATGLKDAVITASGSIDGIPTMVASMEYGFIGGSMGVVVGEKIARGIERAIAGPHAGGDRLLLGRRADDGRRAVADADGENLRRARRGSTAPGCRTSRSSPIRPPAASRRASRCWAT